MAGESTLATVNVADDDKVQAVIFCVRGRGFVNDLGVGAVKRCLVDNALLDLLLVAVLDFCIKFFFRTFYLFLCNPCLGLYFYFLLHVSFALLLPLRQFE